VLDRAAREEVDGSDLEKTPGRKLEVVGHRLGCPVRLQRADRHVAEHGLPVDRRLLVISRPVVEAHLATEDFGHDRRSDCVLRREAPSIRRLHANPARRLERRLGDVRSLELEQPRMLLRARNSLRRTITQRPCPIADYAALGDQQGLSLLAQH
jgi:hypothetical protein